MKFGCVLNQVQSACDLNSSLPQYLWVGATESRDQSLSGMLMSVLAGKLDRLLVLPKWVGLSPDTLDMSSNTSQVLGIPCFGKSIDFQWDLFQQSFAGVGNSISWQFFFFFWFPKNWPPQVLEIPSFDKSIDFQWDLFRQSISY